MREIAMTVFALALALLLAKVQFSRSCDGEGQILICRNIPSYFSPGYLTLVMYVSDLGEINSTTFRSSNLTSVTRLRIDNAGVTGIAGGALGSFQNLTSVSLKHNALTQVSPNWFARPAALGELSLTENQIEVLDETTLDGLVGLTKLSLNKNRIRTISPNSFQAQAKLAELDLSENRMTRVSPQVFGSLGSARIRLDGNPWDCSCGAEDFVAFLKDLQSRSLLDRQMETTCESPPALRGRPVWDVSVCSTSPTPGPPSGHHGPTNALTAAPASSAKAVTTTMAEASQTEPTDAAVTTTPHPATPPARPTSDVSVRPTSTDAPFLMTVPDQTATHVTSTPPETEPLLPPHTGLTDTCVISEPPSDRNTVFTLIVLLVFLCALLFAACFLVVKSWRKLINKTVMPEHQREERNEVEGDSRSNPDQSPGHSENWGPRERPFTRVRAKSADAVLFISPFCASGEDQVTVQNETEAQSRETEKRADGEEKLEKETEPTGEGGIQEENVNSTTDASEKNEKRADAGRNLDESPRCVSATTDTVPYLSIGSNQNKQNLESTDSRGHGSQMGTVLGRVSTWPPTAVQWLRRCEMKEVEEKETEKFPGDVQTAVIKVEQLFTSGKMEEEPKENQTEDLLNAPDQEPNQADAASMKWSHTGSTRLNYETTSVSEVQDHTGTKQEDPAAVGQSTSEVLNLNQEKLRQNQDLNPGGNPTHKTTREETTSKAGQRDEPERAVMGRQRAGRGGTGSKAPTGGASPDDATLLYGNEYAFVDLLHEVVQNNGRWTRERWRQIHANKQWCVRPEEPKEFKVLYK